MLFSMTKKAYDSVEKKYSFLGYKNASLKKSM